MTGIVSPQATMLVEDFTPRKKRVRKLIRHPPTSWRKPSRDSSTPILQSGAARNPHAAAHQIRGERSWRPLGEGAGSIWHPRRSDRVIVKSRPGLSSLRSAPLGSIVCPGWRQTDLAAKRIAKAGIGSELLASLMFGPAAKLFADTLCGG